MGKIVPVSSALGRHARAEHLLAFQPLVLEGAAHLDLLCDERVRAAFRQWLA